MSIDKKLVFRESQNQALSQIEMSQSVWTEKIATWL